MLYNYIKQAKTIISKYALFLLKDEDAISDITEVLIKADLRFNGKGNKDSYRVWCAKLRINRLVTELKNKRKLLTLRENIPCPKLHFTCKTELYDLMEFALNSETISSYEYYLINSHYLENKTLRELSDGQTSRPSLYRLPQQTQA